jgi:hypothetical protein
MTLKRILMMPFLILFWINLVVFFGPYALVYMFFKTLSWLLDVVMGSDESWKEHVWRD